MPWSTAPQFSNSYFRLWCFLSLIPMWIRLSPTSKIPTVQSHILLASEYFSGSRVSCSLPSTSLRGNFSHEQYHVYWCSHTHTYGTHHLCVHCNQCLIDIIIVILFVSWSLFYPFSHLLSFSGYAGVVELDSCSQEYKNLSKKFSKDWASAKGPCPPILTIVKIINPMVSERFERCHGKFLLYQGIEQHYHGTTLCCDLADYAELCDDPNCGACGITRIGFDPQKIDSVSWQRFGKGFYFAPNSSKSYDYAVGNRFGAKIRDKVSSSRRSGFEQLNLCPLVFSKRNPSGTHLFSWQSSSFG